MMAILRLDRLVTERAIDEISLFGDDSDEQGNTAYVMIYDRFMSQAASMDAIRFDLSDLTVNAAAEISEDGAPRQATVPVTDTHGDVDRLIFLETPSGRWRLHNVYAGEVSQFED